MRIQKLVKPIVLIGCVGVMAYALLNMNNKREPLNYNEHLADTAFKLDSEEVTFQDLAFYILYEECKIEGQAMIYNSDYPKDYWNMHTDDKFVQTEAKDAVLGMAVHDHLFYQMAKEEGMDTLTPEEEEMLGYATTDFWEDLLDIQYEKLPCDQETINQQIRIAAIAEKYQNYLAEKDGPSVAAYNYDGYYYSQMLEEHDLKINKKLWNRFVMGDITLNHSKINYINGLTDEDKKKE